MKAVVAAFNQEKALVLVGAFSVITNLRMELFQALLNILALLVALNSLLCLLQDRPLPEPERDLEPGRGAVPGGQLRAGGAVHRPLRPGADGGGARRGAGAGDVQHVRWGQARHRHGLPLPRPRRGVHGLPAHRSLRQVCSKYSKI